MHLRMVAAVSLALAFSAPAVAHKPLLITNVTIIDPYDGSRRPNASVLIVKGRIGRIGPPLRAPRGVETFDATGKFLVPGLWDMHVHVWEPGQLRLYIANGVTAVRNAGGKLDELTTWRKQVASGSLIGPRMFIAGPVLDGTNPVHPDHSIAVPSAAAAAVAVERLARAGADFVKVYDRLGKAEFLAVAAEAKKRGLKLTGHVPDSMSAIEAASAGMRIIDHLDGLIEACTPHEESYRKGLTSWPDLLQSWNQSRADALMQSLIASNTWQVPALVVSHTPAMVSFTPIRPRLRYATRAQREMWSAPDNPFFLNRTPGRLETAMLHYDVANILVGQMRELGLQVMAGSDADGAPFQIPGFSLHDELHLLVDAGYTPMEALRSATVLPARFFGVMADYGPIGPGRIADLLLVDADPTSDIMNIHRIHAVVTNGRLFRRNDLDALFVAVEKENEAGLGAQGSGLSSKNPGGRD